ncbi:hypothetical protein [Flagellimonas sp.]|uniref:hypothetical protein n=1 Tax=Flagellimonas sp. TaxID=2058762 RepID=UPI003BA92CEC
MNTRGIFKLLDKYFGAIFCLIFALGLLYMHFDKPKLKSEKDLIVVSGILQSYSFQDNMGWRKNGKRYTFRLKNYSNDFQISANHLDLFNKIGFQAKGTSGNELSIKIMKDQKDLLNSPNERVLAISIKDLEKEYLNSRNVILKEQGPMELIMGLGLIFAGFLAFIVKYKNLV